MPFEIVRNDITNMHVDAIVNIVDATNLSRSLFFTTQLLELGIPMVVALNKTDINEKKQTRIDIQRLMKELKCPQCGNVFKVDEADYASIVSQVKTQEFDAEVQSRIEEIQKQYCMFL